VSSVSISRSGSVRATMTLPVEDRAVIGGVEVWGVWLEATFYRSVAALRWQVDGERIGPNGGRTRTYGQDMPEALLDRRWVNTLLLAVVEAAGALRDSARLSIEAQRKGVPG